jgi:hypothetical protein
MRTPKLSLTLLLAGLVVCCLNGCYPSSAQTVTDHTPEAKALQEILAAKRDPTNDPKWRLSLADALRRYCESILVQVPRNTPQEDQWVNGELQDAAQLWKRIEPTLNWERWSQDVRRIETRQNKVISSTAFARQSMRNVLTECSAIAKTLIEAKEMQPITEALEWTRLSRIFRAEDEIWRVADIVGLVSQSDCRKLQSLSPSSISIVEIDQFPVFRDKNSLCHWGWTQISIIDHAVIPLLESQWFSSRCTRARRSNRRQRIADKSQRRLSYPTSFKRTYGHFWATIFPAPARCVGD